jgi:hypothetical protein
MTICELTFEPIHYVTWYMHLDMINSNIPSSYWNFEGGAFVHLGFNFVIYT